MSHNDEEALHSASCPFGKCTDEVKTAVPEEVKNELILLAGINNQNVAQYLRDLLCDHIYGHANMVRAKLGKGTPSIGRD